jgi:DNA polymerase-3 subunit delta'
MDRATTPRRSGDDGGKRKPSKEIRVDEIRQAIAFAQTTSARGRAKVVVIHPAERMNGVSANALLKTLEEPPGRRAACCRAPRPMRCCRRSAAAASRCRCAARPAVAARWLREQGVARPT